MKITAALLAAALVAAPAITLAQTPAHNIAARQANQQRRIANGVKSGQLTRSETRHLERQERGIQREKRAMKAQNNGHLTRQDRRVIAHQQNQESRRIYAKKHNARVR
ncbi:MAG: hypothetical protein KGN79_13575 [Acidobacteriota bacterium]|nr:hypothetical protein [Acidobacteriota bacterium]